ncbi:hypothetical protein [Pantoea agglomerans]|uniref:hypothetical protein n=1 Tax=Enterobacter agglomerans TaxID=549 RepID=UPI00301E452A
MTGSVPQVLTASELTLLENLMNRLNWHVTKPILSSLGFSLGRGKDATFDKVLSELSELKIHKPQSFLKTITEIQELMLGQVTYGEKALFNLSVTPQVMASISSSLQTEWASLQHATSIEDILLDNTQVAAKQKNQPELVNFSNDTQSGIALFTSIREQIIKEKIPPASVPQYQGYDEIIAKRKEKRQCFDIFLLDYVNNKINILIDTSGNALGESVLFSKSVMVNKLYGYAGTQFQPSEKDFFPLIQPIFDQVSAPYLGSNYKVFELSFLTPEGTTHQEKKKDASKDLRHDLFNLEGIKAVGQIGLYRIGIRIGRLIPSLQLDDNIELIIPGTLRRFLGGSGTAQVNYAIINNCVSRDDFESLMQLLS